MRSFMMGRFVWLCLLAPACMIGCEAKPAGSAGTSGSTSAGSASAGSSSSVSAPTSTGTPSAAASATAAAVGRPASVMPPVTADIGAAREAAQGIAPEAKQVLSDWYAALSAAKSFTADTTAKFAVLQNKEEVQAEVETYRVAFERPVRLSVRRTKGNGFTVVNDGKQLFQVDHSKNVYTLGDAWTAPADLAKSLVLSRTNLQQGLSMIGDALAEVPLDKITADYESIAYVGQEEIDGAKQHHLRALRDAVHYDWWFDVAKPYALRQVRPNAPEIARKNGQPELPLGLDLQLAVTYDHVAYDAPLAASDFEIKPPADAAQLENIDDELAMTLVGKPAPAFEAPLLEGGAFKLADKKGKIVVLDFWATWCPPCVAGLPKLAEMTAAHKDDGVVFFPVNIEEEPSIIKEFLAAKELKVPVVLDKGDVIKLYKVGPVPQTVFIDREGVVQIVHIGIGELESIPQQLKDLVAGKSFAKKTAEK